MRRRSIAQRCCLTFGCGWDGCGKNRCPARIFINVEGREPLGTVPAAQYEAFRDELAEALRSIPAPDGSDVGTRVFKPQEVYQEVRNIPPDLMGVHYVILTKRRPSRSEATYRGQAGCSRSRSLGFDTLRYSTSARSPGIVRNA